MIRRLGLGLLFVVSASASDAWAQSSPLDDPRALSLAPPDLLAPSAPVEPAPRLAAVPEVVAPSAHPAPPPVASYDPRVVPLGQAPLDGTFEKPASAAVAADSAAGADDGLKKEFESLRKKIEKLEDAAAKRKADDEKKPTAKITAQFQHDSYIVGQDAENIATVGDAVGGEAFRRARIGVIGNYSITEYRIEVDFALAGRPSFLDVWAAINDLPVLGQVKAGHFFEPFLLERLTPNRFVTFMERALPDAFAPARNTGVAASNWYEEENVSWSAGLFRTNSDAFGDDVGEYDEVSLTGRVAWAPIYDEASEGRRVLHLGTGGSFRGADQSTVRFRSRPEATVGATSAIPFFIDTGNLSANTYELFNLETAFVRGPWSVNAEYVWAPVQRINAADPVFTGWYVQTSFFLTGEHRPYDRARGVFGRVEPFEQFFRVRTDRGVEMGRGAWEVAARVSNLDFDSASVQRGALTDLTLGVNWYMTPYLRVTTNYVHAFLDSPAGVESGADVLAARIGYEF